MFKKFISYLVIFSIFHNNVTHGMEDSAAETAPLITVNRNTSDSSSDSDFPKNSSFELFTETSQAQSLLPWPPDRRKSSEEFTEAPEDAAQSAINANFEAINQRYNGQRLSDWIRTSSSESIHNSEEEAAPADRSLALLDEESEEEEKAEKTNVGMEEGIAETTTSTQSPVNTSFKAINQHYHGQKLSDWTRTSSSESKYNSEDESAPADRSLVLLEEESEEEKAAKALSVDYSLVQLEEDSAEDTILEMEKEDVESGRGGVETTTTTTTTTQSPDYNALWQKDSTLSPRLS